MTNDEKQLTLFDAQFSQVRRVMHQGREMFSLVDICQYFSDTENAARVYWSQTKKRLKVDGFELYQNLIQLKLIAPDGKKRLTDVADGRTVLRIIQSIPSAKAEPVRQWLAALGYREIEEAQKPALAAQRREKELEKLYAAGYGDHAAVQQLQARHEGIENLKRLKEAVSALCASPRFGDIFNAEYVALFSMVAKQLETLLETKSIRDALPLLQLRALSYAETSLTLLLGNYEAMSNEQILQAVEVAIRPIGEHLKAISDAAGVHHVTGRKLLR